jgi:hypothetical protein
MHAPAAARRLRRRRRPRITAWHDLPVEAPVEWLLAPFCVVTALTALQLAACRRSCVLDVQH